MRRTLPAALLLALAACHSPDATAPDTLPTARSTWSPPGVTERSVSVLSRNLYFGADLDLLFEPGVDFGQAALQAWATVQHTSFMDRARALAAEIAEVEPHLIGLQEVVTYTVLDPGFSVIAQQSHLTLLLQELAALGLDYRIGVFTSHTTFTAPVGDLQSPSFYVNFLDAEAILVRGDVQTPSFDAGIYAAGVPLPIGISIRHAWQTVDAVVGGSTIRFANTHLETQSFPTIQEAQTAELITVLEDSPWPVVLVGDLNSAANRSAPEDRKTATYGMLLDAGFVDLWTRTGPSNKGLTCCHDSDLSNATAGFDQRLDLVLARNKHNGSGFAGGAAMDILGEGRNDRFTAQGGQTLWPSDHAGVAATIWMPSGLASR